MASKIFWYYQVILCKAYEVRDAASHTGKDPSCLSLKQGFRDTFQITISIDLMADSFFVDDNISFTFGS